MSLTVAQRGLLVGSGVVAVGAAIAGGVALTTSTPPKVAQAPPAPVYKWPHTIAVDTLTGRLYPGFVDGNWSLPVGGIYECGVATDSATNKRVLTVQVVEPVKYNTLCQGAEHQWDSAEVATQGRWPKS